VWLIHYENAAGTVNNWPPGYDPVVAYSFSVDDGIGNIMVNNTKGFEVAVGGANGLTNPQHYPTS